VATFFSPLLAMAGIPTRFDTVEESYPKAMKLVLSCIAVPLLLVYAAILYSYAAKILITWELPKGGVAYLVTAFGGAGMMAYLASYPLHREPGVLRVFGRWFFPILLVPLALFAVAIGVRIHAYGVTEERYAILLCFFWLAISAVLGLVRPGGQILKGVLSTLTVLLIAASFGPWSAANLSASSQLHRLETLLEKNRVLVQGRIDPSPKDISRDDRIRISGLMDYLVETEKTDRLTPWFADLPDARIHEKKETVPQVTNMQVRLMQEMGIAYVEEYDRGGVESSSFHFVNSDMEQAVLSVSGYDYLLTLEDNRPDHAKQVTLQKSGAVLTLTFDRAAGRYVVHIEDTKEDVVFDLKTLLGRLDKKQLKTNAVAGERLFIDNASSKLAMRLIVNRAYGEIKKDGSPALSTIDALLLVKEK